MRIVILVCAFSLFQTVSWAQKFLNKVSVQPRAGLSFTKLINSKSPFSYGTYETQAIIAFSYGALIQYRLTNRISILGGYSSEVKGATDSYESVTFMNDYVAYKRTKRSVENKYNTFPLFARFNLKKDKISFFADLGIYISSLNSSLIDGYIVDFDNLGNFSFSLLHETEKQFTNSIDYGLMLGGGVGYQLNSRLTIQFNPQLSIGLRKLDRYNSNDRVVLIGSSSMIILEKDYFELSSESKNVLFAMNIGLNYSIHK